MHKRILFSCTQLPRVQVRFFPWGCKAHFILLYYIQQLSLCKFDLLCDYWFRINFLFFFLFNLLAVKYFVNGFIDRSIGRHWAKYLIKNSWNCALLTLLIICVQEWRYVVLSTYLHALNSKSNDNAVFKLWQQIFLLYLFRPMNEFSL